MSAEAWRVHKERLSSGLFVTQGHVVTSYDIQKHCNGLVYIDNEIKYLAFVDKTGYSVSCDGGEGTKPDFKTSVIRHVVYVTRDPTTQTTLAETVALQDSVNRLIGEVWAIARRDGADHVQLKSHGDDLLGVITSINTIRYQPS